MKVVTAAIVQRDGKYLVCRRKTPPLEGKWEFPGGKLEPGETPEQCLRRELKEELGVDAQVGDFFAETTYKYEFGAIRLQAYSVKLEPEEIKLRVHDAFFWGTPRELLDLDLLPADVAIVRKLEEMAITSRT